MELLNRVYDGFDAEGEVFEFLKDLKYKSTSRIKVIKFKEKFYVVAIDLDKKFIAGKEMIFATEAEFTTMMDVKRFKTLNPVFPEFKEMPFNYLDGFYREFIKEDFGFMVYSVEGDGEFLMLCEANDSSNAYVVNLAMTFCKTAFNKDNINCLDRYIKDVSAYAELYDKYINVVAVYPTLDAVIFKYKEKNEYVRAKIEDGALVLQDPQFAIEDPLKSAKSEEVKAVNKGEEWTIYVLSNIVDDKVYFGVHSKTENPDEILDELLLEMDRPVTNLAKCMNDYGMHEFKVTIVKHKFFSSIDERNGYMTKLIGKNNRNYLTPVQQRIRNAYVSQVKS